MIQFIRNNLPFTGYPYIGEQIRCNLCGSKERTVICDTDRRWKKLVTVACTDCGLMRTDPMPTDAELELYYRHDYRLDYQLAGDRPPGFHVVRSNREASSRAARLSAFLKPGAKVLDLGCGTGEFLNAAKKAGCEVTGIEPGETYARFARSEYAINVINAPWQQADLPPGSFDLVTCQQVVEHLRDPMAAIAAMVAWLKPEGALYISVPDMRANAKPSFERFHFAHIYGFTAETLDVALRLNQMVSISGERLESTTGVFRKDPALDPASVIVRDRSRTERLVESYRPDSVADYVLRGGYFRHAAHRFGKWRRDAFPIKPASADNRR
ncbi:MAG: class I SAM-dependent methyltransferase [Hyphomonas sp.]